MLKSGWLTVLVVAVALAVVAIGGVAIMTRKPVMLLGLPLMGLLLLLAGLRRRQGRGI